MTTKNNLIPSVHELAKMFQKINADCLIATEGQFSDIEYYTEQIMNIFEVPEMYRHVAADLAVEMSIKYFSLA